VAAQLAKNQQLRVRRERGSLGELRVVVDGETVVESGPLAYPSPGSVIARVETHLAAAGPQ
jgi:hypothetical protein